MEGGGNIAVSKCVKCDADIPEGAAFCPACGAPKPAEKPAAQPAQPQPSKAPAPQAVPKGPSSILGILDTIFSDVIIFSMFLLGVLLAGIGGLLFTFSGFNATLNQAGTVINVLGFMFMSVFLLMGGLVNKKFDHYVRFGMIVGGAIMLTWSLAIPA